MQRRKDQVIKSLLKVYAEHPLMTNVTLKTHAFLKQSGLHPKFKSVFIPEDYTTIAVVHYADKEADDIDQRKPINALIKNNSLSITIYNSMCLNIKYDEDVQTKVNLQLEQLNGYKKAKGVITQLYIPQTDATGIFDEDPLHYFLKSCLNGFPKYL